MTPEEFQARYGVSPERMHEIAKLEKTNHGDADDFLDAQGDITQSDLIRLLWNYAL